MNLRSSMQNDLRKLIGNLPVMCGRTQNTQTIECAWLSQRDEVRFASIGVLGEDSSQIIVSAADLSPAPNEGDVLWVSGHRYRVSSVERIDVVSLRITLARSDL